jgi:uncharacterized protein YdaU (DUF1376 family)
MRNESTRGTSPGMMIYASDLMVKKDYRVMSFAERGMFFSMLCECWANGELPADQDELSALLGKDVTGLLTARVTGFFTLSDHGMYSSKDIEDYRTWVINGRARMSEGGKKGAETRAKSKEASNGVGKPLSKVVGKHLDKQHGDFQPSTLQGLEYEYEYEVENHPNQGGNLLSSNKGVA